MSLAIFDLDNTLIADDSDYLWGQFLVEQGIVDSDVYADANEKFYNDYKHGKLDIVEFLNFSLKPLADNDVEQLYRWRENFIAQKIQPILLPAAQQLIQHHRQKGDTLLIITATNRFITEPIADLYGIKHLIATTPEIKHGQFTGNFTGIPSFQEGKVQLLQQWLLDFPTESLGDSWFYSDSHNDLPLLKRVKNPVAVDPDATLRIYALEQQWQILSLREASA
ncbi:MAG: HAD family hydrolase [Methylococcaceae bacterium]|nr:HAD family hydrolase [Methylococcaceae bacterium]